MPEPVPGDSKTTNTYNQIGVGDKPFDLLAMAKKFHAGKPEPNLTTPEVLAFDEPAKQPSDSANTSENQDLII